jgi:hypothetical protein
MRRRNRVKGRRNSHRKKEREGKMKNRHTQGRKKKFAWG